MIFLPQPQISILPQDRVKTEFKNASQSAIEDPVGTAEFRVTSTRQGLIYNLSHKNSDTSVLGPNNRMRTGRIACPVYFDVHVVYTAYSDTNAFSSTRPYDGFSFSKFGDAKAEAEVGGAMGSHLASAWSNNPALGLYFTASTGYNNPPQRGAGTARGKFGSPMSLTLIPSSVVKRYTYYQATYEGTYHYDLGQMACKSFTDVTGYTGGRTASARGTAFLSIRAIL